MRSRRAVRYITVALDWHFRPWHWLQPATVGGDDWLPVCGYTYPANLPIMKRTLEASRGHNLVCPDCKRAFLLQRQMNRKPRRL